MSIEQVLAKRGTVRSIVVFVLVGVVGMLIGLVL